MPTIVLRNITLQFSGDPNARSFLSDMSRSTSRIFDRRKTYEYMDSKHPLTEPPDRHHAIDHLSLTIHDGETLALLGPSGCGKTTLLRVIAGLIQPDEGRVFYDGVELKDIPLDKRGIGMVFQNYALFPHMKAQENIGFFDILRRQPEKIPDRIKHISQIMGVDIKYLLHRKPPTLSGGEQQRVAVAHCLARDPKLFLFDEPLSNLDAKLRTETRIQIKRLLNHYKITSVYVTHDQVEAIALADRIAIMQAGQIVQIGTYNDIYETPINAFTAGFFGNPPMNLFDGFIQNERWEGRGFSVSPVRPGLISGQAIQLGIRPESVQLTDTGIEARVELIEPILPERIQLVYLQMHRQRCVARIPIETTVEKGSTVYVQLPPEACYLFDQKTGARIG